ncbi:predicted protein [Lichtheimia corymbifera JMRC:FSU:9682]|uniref:Uncharacterized protein n=1 Tax=Lichtheimia corymbifera JMRC:FSU:9682 TaxID=1263082 RepID=A0A068RJQ8_9FUNG|nr:predicted protein [Lichtheimia corymbifera JMRC:FSU:9682]
MDNSTTHDHNANAPDAVHEDKNTVDKGDDHPTDGSFDEEEEDRGTLDQPSSSSTTATTAATEDNKAVDDDDFGDFGDNNDEFGDFDDFQSTEDFDDFQSMDDGFGPIEQQEDNDADMNAPPQPATPPKPTEAEEYIRVLDTAQHSTEITAHLDHFFKHIWSLDDNENHQQQQQGDLVASPTSMEPPTKILCTPCSENLWDKLSRDSVFYNPITGSIGQFQWTRSETNKAYLTALGVTINYEEKSSPSSGSMGSPAMGSKRPQSNYLDTKQTSSPRSMERRSSPNHTRSTSLSGVHVPVTESRQHSDDDDDEALENGNKKPSVEEEPELDIDIAKAYCELTEETIRIFPDEKLKSMVTELSRLQRQATEYLTYLLDQREQLMMDAETYNDLISCIVGHAQRLREQHVGRDASPAMVSKKKKTGGSLSMLRRKQNSSGASMGGGVVGLKQGSTTTNATQKKNIPTSTTAEGRRSM